MDQIKTVPTELYGSAIAGTFVNQLFSAKDQATACRALVNPLCMAFGHDEQDAVEAIAGGFSTTLVNVLERGRDAIRDDVTTRGDEK